MRIPVSFASSRWQVQLKTVVVYDSHGGLTRAHLLMDQLAAQCGSAAAVKSSFWYVGLLGHPQWWQQAAAEAAEGGLVIISVNQATGLSAEVKNWLADWLPGRRGGHAAMVVLLDRVPRPEMEPFVAFLRNKAGEGGLDFFSSRYGPWNAAKFTPQSPQSAGWSMLPLNFHPLTGQGWSINN